MSEERIKILFVDDDEDDYILTRDLLSRVNGTDYEMEWTPSYKAALRSIHEENYDVFLFDYRLGEQTGLDLLKEVMAAGCKAPVILLTGQADRDTDIEAIKSGATDYLEKSEINSHLLERSIRYALERKRTEERIIHMAYYDGLTELPNRSLFRDRLEKAIAHAARYGSKCAILFIDIDDFKKINDTLEHWVGDLLLKAVAERLHSYVRGADTVARRGSQPVTNTVARLGGDEFTILLSEIHSPQNAAKVSKRILDIISRQFHIEGYEIFVTASIGIAVYPSDGEDADILIKNADTAMYHSKEHGKNHFHFYEPYMNAMAFERLNMENSLRKALERREFLLYYQPRIEVSTGCVMSMEALVRWNHPQRGIVSPLEFIPVAEETGLVIPLGKWIIETACDQIREWQKDGSICAPVSVSLNLSGHQFNQDNLLNIIKDTLKQSGLDPQYLELEITESVIMKGAERTKTLLNSLKDMGIRLSMDDFGTGYSSFSYLKSFPLDNIKIDRSFIRDITENSDDCAIVKAIIAMAHNLKLRVVAEGVETKKQFQVLREAGCDEMQGFLFSRPLPANEITEMLKYRENIDIGAL